MAFTPIDEQTWERREYLEVFRQTAIYLTAEVDITPLYRHTKARGEKLYPALIWCAAAVLNRHVHFRYGRDEAGRIGIWDCLLYTSDEIGLLVPEETDPWTGYRRYAAAQLMTANRITALRGLG